MGKPPLSAEDFHSIDTLSDPQVSPDDRWIAFVRQTVDRAENKYKSAIWLALSITNGINVQKLFFMNRHLFCR